MRLRFSKPLQLVLLLVSCLDHSCRALSFNVRENVPNGTYVGTLFQNVQGLSGFLFNGQGCSSYFAIIATSSAIVTTPALLDREAIVLAQGTDSLSCVAQYSNGSTTIQLQFGVTVLDENDVVPRFLNMNKTAFVNLPTSYAVGNSIMLLQPTDPDKGPNGTVSFYVIPGPDSSTFRINRLSGDTDPKSTTRVLELNQTLAKADYNVSILLSDAGTPPLTFVQTIIVRTVNYANVLVSFVTSRVVYSVNEKYPIGKAFAYLPIMPANLSLSYQVADSGTQSGGNDCCAVYPDGGIYFTRTINVDDNPRDANGIQVTVTVPSVQSTTANCIVTITINDTNDHAPNVAVIESPLSPQSTPFRISGGVVDSRLLTVLINVGDKDHTRPNNQIGNFSVTFDPPVGTLNASVTMYYENNWLVTVSGGIFDQIPSLTMNIYATDQGTPPQTGRQSYPLIVEGPPQFSVVNATSLAEGAPIGKSVLTVEATRVDKGANTYSIVGADKIVASSWFSIDSMTGIISVASDLNRTAVNGTVRLTVMAVNAATSPSSSSTSLTINIPPPIVSFQPQAYQYHSGYSIIDLLNAQSGNLYMEFYVLRDGTLLWEEKGDGTVFSLDIVNGCVQASRGGAVVAKSSVVVTHQMWYSLLLFSSGGSIVLLQVWKYEHLDNRTAVALMSAQMHCSTGTSNRIYLGGQQPSMYRGFVGSLKNVIVGPSQLDLTCPSASFNTSEGPIQDFSTCPTSTCPGSNWCLNVRSKHICGFAGGFLLAPPQVKTAYNPVGFTGLSGLYFTLDSDFFADAARTTPTSSVLQVVNFSFRPMSLNGSYLLLQSKTISSIHVLKFVTNDGGLTTLVYQVDTLIQNTQSTSLIISQFIQISVGSMYNVSLQLTSSGATVSYNTQSQSGSWVQGRPASLFATYPSTQIVLGNTPGQAGGEGWGLQYTGCIRSLSVNGIMVPLTGLLTSVGGYNKVASAGTAFPSCSVCGGSFPPLCNAASSSCVEDQAGPEVCRCLPGFVAADNNSCVATLVVHGVFQTQGDQKFPLVAIVGAVAGTLVLLILVAMTVIVALRCRMRKTFKQHTYSVTPEPNNYDPKYSPKRSSLSLKSQHSQQGDGSDVSSQPAPIDTSDRQSDTNNSVTDGCGVCPPSHPSELARTKSVTSAETSFNANGERDDRRLPRIEEPINSQLETGSEDTSCMEEILSPAGVNLIGSMSQNLGIMYQPVLTEVEKKILTPLRPGPEEPLSLTVSEYAADVVADRPAFNYRLHPPFNTLQSMPEGREVPSSSRATPLWYKSNVSDSESEDARRNTEGRRRNEAEDGRSRKVSGSIPKVTSMPPHVVMAHEVTAAAVTPPSARECAPSRCQRHRLHSADSPLVHSHSYKYGRQNSCRSAGGQRGLSPLELSSEGSEGYSYTVPRHPRYGSPPYFDAARPDVDYSAHVTPPRSAGPYGQQEFKDLKSVSNINPILYWEMQSRMKTTVDQDPYPLSHMEDASTQTNSDVFTDPLNVDFSNERNTTAMMLSSVADLTPNCHTDTTTKIVAPPVALGNDDDDDDYDDKPEMGPTHFPSADCSDEYGRKSSGGTLEGTQSDDESTRLSLSSDYDPVPPQMSFDT